MSDGSFQFDYEKEIQSLKRQLAEAVRERDEAALKRSEALSAGLDTLSAMDRIEKERDHAKAQLTAVTRERDAYMEDSRAKGGYILKLARLLECFDGDDLPEDRIAEMKAELAKLRDGWISVTERLPEDTKARNVRCPENRNTFTAYWKNGAWWIFGAFETRVPDEVTHYRDLPAPPNDGRAE